MRRTAAATTTWSPGPGEEVQLGADFFASGVTHRRQLEIMINAILVATRGIPAALVPQYAALIEKVRIHHRGTLP